MAGDDLGFEVRDDNEAKTMKDRWDRIVSAIKNPLNVSMLSPNGDTGLVDYIPACKDFFIGFAKDDPEQAGTCFFYTIAAIKIIILIHILAWIF